MTKNEAKLLRGITRALCILFGVAFAAWTTIAALIATGVCFAVIRQGNEVSPNVAGNQLLIGIALIIGSLTCSVFFSAIIYCVSEAICGVLISTAPEDGS